MATVINAQKKGDSFVCISDGVNVRKGPGTTYPVCELSLAVLDESGGMPHKGETQKQQLFKGYGTQLTHIEYLGKKENDYLYVNCYEEVEGFGGEGWVSSKFLKPQCDVCKGNPVYIQNGKEIICSHCKGKGYVDLETQSKIPSNNPERMPASAKSVAENEEYSILINEEPMPESLDVKKISLWVLNKKTQKSSRIFVTNPSAKSDWWYGLKQSKVVSLNDIRTISKVCILSWIGQPLKLLVEGKGPTQTMSLQSFIIEQNSDKAICLPTDLGLIGLSYENNLLIMQSDRYYEDGDHYNVIEAFDINGKRICKMDAKTR